jgi:hypothetical protein
MNGLFSTLPSNKSASLCTKDPGDDSVLKKTSLGKKWDSMLFKIEKKEVFFAFFVEPCDYKSNPDVYDVRLAHLLCCESPKDKKRPRHVVITNN